MTISDKNVEHSAAERGGGAAEKRGEHQENLCVTGHRGHQEVCVRARRRRLPCPRIPGQKSFKSI